MRGTRRLSVLLLVGAACAAPARVDDGRHASYLAHVAAADSALRLGELAEFRRWLERAPETERGYEWRWLDSRRDQALAARALGCGSVLALDVSPDGALLAVSCGDGTVLVEERDAKRELWRAKLHTDGVHCVRFDAQGERIVSASRDRSVKVWNARTGELLVDFKQHNFPVWAAAFSPDGERVASCSYERPPGTVVGSVRVWNSRTGAEERTLEAGVKPLSSIEFGPDGKSLACGSWGFCVLVWDLAAGGEPRAFAMPDEGKYNAIDALAFSPDGASIAAASKDDTARVWRLADGALTASLRGHSNYVTAIRFSPDGATLATAASDETVRLWRAADGEPLEVLRGHTEGVRSLAFSRDGERLYSGANDGELREWDPTTRAYDWTVLETAAAAYWSTFSNDGTRLYTCSFDGQVQVWSTATWEQLASFAAHPAGKSCHALALSPDGATLYTASYDGAVGVFDTVTTEELGRLKHDVGVYTLRLSRDGQTLAVAQMNGEVALWNTATREKLGAMAAAKSPCHDLGFSVDGKLLAIGADAAKLGLWDVGTRTLIRELDHGTFNAHSCLFTSDGERLLVGDASGNVHVWRTGDWQRQSTVACFNGSVDRIALSPDGRRAAAVSRELALVDVERGELAAVLRPHSGGIFHVDWSPDGHVIATAAQSEGIGLTDDRPIGVRLAAIAAARARAAASDEWVAAGLDLAQRTLAQLRDDVRADASLSAEDRDARLAALTRTTEGRTLHVLGYLGQ
ncbi:MAG: WD40 repeat domain-containing protein [Planctomycetes bacterium]|nr:WD40 repeat domain-containing protein [Planctomycetota bacterium]